MFVCLDLIFVILKSFILIIHFSLLSLTESKGNAWEWTSRSIREIMSTRNQDTIVELHMTWGVTINCKISIWSRNFLCVWWRGGRLPECKHHIYCGKGIGHTAEFGWRERHTLHSRGYKDRPSCIAASLPKCNSLMHSESRRSNKKWKSIFNNETPPASLLQREGWGWEAS